MKDIRTLFSMLGQLKYIMSAQQRRKTMYLFGVILLGSLFEMLGVSIILPFIQSILTPEEVVKKWYVAPIINFFNIRDPYSIIICCGIAIIVLYLIKNVYLLIAAYAQSKFKCGFQKDMSVHLLKAYMNRPYTYFLKTNSAEIMRGINTDVVGSFEIIHVGFKLLAEFLSVLLISLFIIYMDPFMAIGIIVLAGISFLAITFGFKQKLSEIGKQQRKANAKRMKYAYEAVTGFKEIKVMQRADFFVDEYNHAYEEQRTIDIRFETINAAPERIIETVCIAGLIIVICIRLGLGVDAETFIPKLSVFAMAAFRILPSISRMAGYLNSLVFYRPALEGVYQELREVEKYQDYLLKYRSDNSIVSGKESLKESFDSQLEVKNISWHYENSKLNVLEQLSLTISKGESVAFIGVSGAGKTTLADSILGLLQPQKGEILVDGIDIFTIPKEWSEIIGYVPQSVFLTDDTLKANISFGIPEKDIQIDKIWKALEQAQLKEFVENLPDGLETIVGERGIKFSGGQRQRVAIARALYYNPDILVLDEATSALDNDTEFAVMGAIDALQGEKTLIIVAHRLSTIKKCDKIYQVKEGKAQIVNKDRFFSES